MNKEDYVSYDVAKLLKEKGITIVSDHHYFTEDIMINGEVFVPKEVLTQAFFVSRGYDNIKIYAPSLYEVVKRLRRTYNIDVCPFIETSSPYKDYCCRIYKWGKFLCDKVAYCNYYEEALNDGIREALNYIKNEESTI